MNPTRPLAAASGCVNAFVISVLVWTLALAIGAYVASRCAARLHRAANAIARGR
jgi:hypothetical protein